MNKKPFARTCLLMLFVEMFVPPVSPIVGQQPSTAPASSSSAPPQQEQPTAVAPEQQNSRTPDDDVVRITTNLVQVDVVVTDKNNRQVTDLKAEDFEMSENDHAQPITNFSYVSDDSAPPAAATSLSPADRRQVATPPAPPVRLRPEQVRRTVALVVDDLGLSFESTAFVRDALRKFVAEQMQPNDLVAIIRTSAGSGVLQQFTSDRQQLAAAVEGVRWYPVGRGGISAIASFNGNSLAGSAAATAGAGSGAGSISDDETPSAEDGLEDFREEIFSVGTLGALNFVVRGLRELPGRKSVVLFSDGLPAFARNGRSSGNRTLEALRRLTDLANRASVVVYTIDARGLPTLSLTAADNTSNSSANQVQQMLSNRRARFIESQDGLNYLAEETGGLFIHNVNSLSNGVRRVLDDQKGYYLIGYRPDSSTFNGFTGARRFHKLQVKVKRPGLRVRSRTGFYGFTDEEAIATQPRTRNEQLMHALNSPFAPNGIHLRLTSLFGNEPNAGSFMRSLLHIPARDLSFTQEKDGWHKADIDVFAVTFGYNGTVVDQFDRTHTIRVRGATHQLLQQNGLVYTLDVPVRKAGAYQLRIAVRDAASTRVGSSSQFIEVPDINKNRLALSGIIVSGYDPKTASSTVANPTSPVTDVSKTSSINNVTNAAGAAGAAGAAAPPPAVSATAQASSARTTAATTTTTTTGPNEASDSAAPVSPAVRRLQRGMALEYGYIIYNAQLDRTTRRPNVETQIRVFRDGKQMYDSKPAPLGIDQQQTDLRRLAVGGALPLSQGAASGEYVLQIIVTDLLAKQKHRTATQWIDFEIVK